MTAYVALLRAVNVGGTGKLPMTTLVKMCEAAGFGEVRTYIASGNAIFNSRLKERKVKALLEERLALGTREIYIYYGDGMADTKLVIPAAKAGTARNMNTIAKLAAMAADA